VTSSRLRQRTTKSNERNDLRALATTPEPTGTNHAKRERGRPTIDYPSTLSPTIGDIREAASFYEGEGCYSNSSVTINQNDREKLDWLTLRFGGKVYGPYTGKPKGNDYYSWKIVRERALGFMFTVFMFLSKSRREQFRTGKREYQQTICDSGISEEFVKRNIDSSIKLNNRRFKGPMKLFGVKK